MHQVRYKHELKILLELTERLVAVRDAAIGLRPEAGYGDINDPEVKKTRMGRYIDAARELYVFIETRQPFFPDIIYTTLKMLDEFRWKKFVEFKNRRPDDTRYWENALKNGADIEKLARASSRQDSDAFPRSEGLSATDRLGTLSLSTAEPRRRN